MAKKVKAVPHIPGKGELDRQVDEGLKGLDPKAGRYVSMLRDGKKSRQIRLSVSGILANQAVHDKKAAHMIIRSLGQALNDEKADDTQIEAAVTALKNVVLLTVDGRYDQAGAILMKAEKSQRRKVSDAARAAHMELGDKLYERSHTVD